MSTRDVSGPDPRGQPVVGVVRQGYRLVLIVEGDDGENRSEDLLAGDAHVVGDTGVDRRLDEISRSRGAADDRTGAFRGCHLQVVRNLVALRGGGQGAEFVAHRRRLRGEGIDHTIVHGAFDQQPRAC